MRDKMRCYITEQGSRLKVSWQSSTHNVLQSDEFQIWLIRREDHEAT